MVFFVVHCIVFPVFFLLRSYLLKNNPETCRVHYIKYLRFHDACCIPSIFKHLRFIVDFYSFDFLHFCLYTILVTWDFIYSRNFLYANLHLNILILIKIISIVHENEIRLGNKNHKIL